MNANQLINIIFRLFVRKAVSRGIDAGMNRVAAARKDNSTVDNQKIQKQAQNSGAQNQTKQQARQARRAVRMARRAARM